MNGETQRAPPESSARIAIAGDRSNEISRQNSGAASLHSLLAGPVFQFFSISAFPLLLYPKLTSDKSSLEPQPSSSAASTTTAIVAHIVLFSSSMAAQLLERERERE